MYQVPNTSIHSRLEARTVLSLATRQQETVLDLSNVSFISRSAAHELLTYSYRGAKLELLHIQPHVAEMLASVERTLSRATPYDQPFVVHKANNLKEFADFFQ